MSMLHSLPASTSFWAAAREVSRLRVAPVPGLESTLVQQCPWPPPCGFHDDGLARTQSVSSLVVTLRGWRERNAPVESFQHAVSVHGWIGGIALAGSFQLAVGIQTWSCCSVLATSLHFAEDVHTWSCCWVLERSWAASCDKRSARRAWLPTNCHQPAPSYRYWHDVLQASRALLMRTKQILWRDSLEA